MVNNRKQKTARWALALIVIVLLVVLLPTALAFAGGPYWGYAPGSSRTGTGSWGETHSLDWTMYIPDDYWGEVWAGSGSTATWIFAFNGTHSDVNAIDLMGCNVSGPVDLYAYDSTLYTWQLVQSSVSDCADATTNLSTSSHHYYPLANPGDD